jgi:NAD+ synthase (glutamine-hydrolysing)
VSTQSFCSANSFDWDPLYADLILFCRQAKTAGSRLRIGPELEVTGYGCEDHFLENDTIDHAWMTVASLLSDDTTDGIIVDLGMPLVHRGVRYNARVFLLNRKILLVRPKLHLADDGNYRESRWFTAYRVPADGRLEQLQLPEDIAALTAQSSVPFGIGVIQATDATIACETCEELFTPLSPHIAASLDGVDIIGNGSGSHHQLRKLHTRVDLMRSATTKGGGVYLYANQQGCDGGRLYFDGCALVLVNGECVAQASQFSLKDVEVITAVVDLDDVRSFRAAIVSRSNQASASTPLPRVPIDFRLAAADLEFAHPTPARPVHYLTPEEEIALGPSCWLWDFLRRSGAAGFLLPLSGGADSASTCALVGIMCQYVMKEIEEGNEVVLRDLRRILSESDDYVPADHKAVANRIMHTCYMGTTNSTTETRSRAAAIAAQVGTYHLNASIDTMVAAVVSVFLAVLGSQWTPKYSLHGGTRAEDLALQNIQARLRMVLAYFLAQLLPWVRSKKGFLLVLGSANVDEALRGYMTKYDCSSADINPIGGIAKGDLKRFLLYSADAYAYPVLRDVVLAPPTAELQPVVLGADGKEVIQLDEVDMGMSYEELGWFGRLRKVHRCGPFSMYVKLLGIWSHLAPAVVAEKVKRFFVFYSINRHKCTTLTPSYHAESYSPDDNRFDLRQFLYNTTWDRQFALIDADASKRTAFLAASGE